MPGPRSTLLVSLMAISAISLIGCTGGQEDGGAAAKPGNSKGPFLLRITREDFFTGELKRLERHVDFEGYRLIIASRKGFGWIPRVETWLHGTKVRDRVKQGYVFSEGDQELTMSSRVNKLANGRYTVQLKFDGRYAFERTVSEPETNKTDTLAFFGPVELPYKPPLEVSTKRELPVVLWAAGRGNAGHAATDLEKREETEALLRTAAWVVAVRLHPE
jgi:hypothetical protein